MKVTKVGRKLYKLVNSKQILNSCGNCAGYNSELCQKFNDECLLEEGSYWQEISHKDYQEMLNKQNKVLISNEIREEDILSKIDIKKYDEEVLDEDTKNLFPGEPYLLDNSVPIEEILGERAVKAMEEETYYESSNDELKLEGERFLMAKEVFEEWKNCDFEDVKQCKDVLYMICERKKVLPSEVVLYILYNEDTLGKLEKFYCEEGLKESIIKDHFDSLMNKLTNEEV